MAVAVDKIGRLQQISRAHAGQAGAADAYHRFHAVLRAYLVKRTSVRHEADDVLQEVYLRLARMPPRTSILNLKSFVFKTAMNLLRDRSRRVYTRMMGAALTTDDIDVPDVCADPQRILESRQTLSSVVRTVSALKPNTQRAFLLHRVELKSHAEVAAEMGISTSMVEKHVSAALLALRSNGLSAD